MTEWKPGDVALVTYRLGQCTERNICAKADKGWDCLAPGVGFLMHGDVIDARPLVVIDPEDWQAIERLHALWCAAIVSAATSSRQIESMQAALREFAAPTPPKPPEPLGLGAVVEDAEEHLHTRCRNDSQPWCGLDGRFRPYADIAVKLVLSHGVEPLADRERERGTS